jgi:DNA-binding transcriptional ArsR family regulator
MPLRQRVVGDVATLFGVLGHPTRLKILSLLHETEHDVSDLREKLQVTATNVSQHLAILRAQHLVTVRREGTRLFYALRDPRVAELINQALDILEADAVEARALHRAIGMVRLKAQGPD